MSRQIASASPRSMVGSSAAAARTRERLPVASARLNRTYGEPRTDTNICSHVGRRNVAAKLPEVAPEPRGQPPTPPATPAIGDVAPVVVDAHAAPPPRRAPPALALAPVLPHLDHPHRAQT